MDLYVLSDNNAAVGFNGEWGLSYFIEDNGTKILFDTGGSDLFIQSAVQVGLHLEDLDYVVLSHGHWDHTWGLEPLIRLYVKHDQPSLKRPAFIAHPYAFFPKYKKDLSEELGMIIPAATIGRIFSLKLIKEPFWITEKLLFLGEIERRIAFESQPPKHKIQKPDLSLEDDRLLDDTALVYRTSQGLIVITGCSHSGICNIIEYAKKICCDQRVVSVIGGFHLLKPAPEQLRGTVNYFKDLNCNILYACHCTDLASKIALAQVANLQEIKVGEKLNFDSDKP